MNEPVAIVGLSCRFPGGDDPEAFHRALLDDAPRFLPPPRERWAWCAQDGVRVPRVGRLDDPLGFDCARFRISPREAETMDPHQRLMLEEALRALEDAGWDPDTVRGRAIGVFVAVYAQDFQLHARDGAWDEISRLYLATGSAHSVVPNRISYVLDLRGPSEVVDTACSSGLVALHRAVAAIQAGECAQALVGGVSLLLEPSRIVRLQELGLLAPDGCCSPFDAGSRGQVLGEGVGALVLKPLAAALRDGDRVRAIVRGTGVNHQGARSGGLTRPSAAAQAELIRRVHDRDAIDPGEVGYVEAHGNGGTGDAIELLAFQEIYPSGIPVGSVKGHIGFLEAAGGISQLVKVVGAIDAGVMPGTAGHARLLEAEGLRPDSCRILREATPLDALARPGAPFTAGVHAYGLGGCNAHVVLAAPSQEIRVAARRPAREPTPLRRRRFPLPEVRGS
ncbi:beta-ketoacyl [acyl carrier protein] synthase domain-containing protein [Salinarimonas chemoclinalis]|uniref:beta-ketoacyl [acyl carrier protein] synthase domain-containing protein n=1 Tax=Salinarimonas chemoclinalis TaxID=3241599 RepID=UPI003556BFAB